MWPWIRNKRTRLALLAHNLHYPPPLQDLTLGGASAGPQPRVRLHHSGCGPTVVCSRDLEHIVCMQKPQPCMDSSLTSITVTIMQQHRTCHQGHTSLRASDNLFNIRDKLKITKSANYHFYGYSTRGSIQLFINAKMHGG